MNNREIYRPRSNLFFTGFGVLIWTLFTWSNFYDSSTRAKIVSVLVALSAFIGIYIFLIRPKILFSDEGLVITNPIDEFTIGWADVISYDTKWAFTVETKEFTVRAWAATASGRKRRSIHESEIKGLDIGPGGSIRTADSPHTDSGAVAFRTKVHLKRFAQREGAISLPTSRKRQIQPALSAVGLLVAALAVALLGH